MFWVPIVVNPFGIALRRPTHLPKARYQPDIARFLENANASPATQKRGCAVHLPELNTPYANRSNAKHTRWIFVGLKNTAVSVALLRSRGGPQWAHISERRTTIFYSEGSSNKERRFSVSGQDDSLPRGHILLQRLLGNL